MQTLKTSNLKVKGHLDSKETAETVMEILLEKKNKTKQLYFTGSELLTHILIENRKGSIANH